MLKLKLSKWGNIRSE